MSNTERKKILNYRNDNGLAPNPNNIDYGEIAIGYKKDNEAIYIKNTANEIVDFTPISIVNITYNELKELRDNSKLKPSQYYRITDFVTTVANDPEAQSAGHQFDIIVMASKKNKLQEECYAIQHEGVTYFDNCNLAAWKIWYCLDNDTTKYAWADTTYGKGVIYRMIDEWENDCPYDFKNVQFKRYAVEDTSSNGELSDLDGTYIGYNGEMKGLSLPSNLTEFVWAYTFSFGARTTTPDDASIIGYNNFKLGEGYGDKGYYGDNSIKPTSMVMTVDSSTSSIFCLNNIVWWTNNTRSRSLINGNRIESECFNMTLSGNGTIIEHDCQNFIMGDGCSGNVFGTGGALNTFGNSCGSNSFGNSCDGNSFGNGCVGNTFGNDCDNNQFGNNCGNNSFGNGCSINTFGNDCYSNSFGNDCQSNSFGNNCNRNSFGNDCQSNSFGNNCYSNSFGNYCGSNSFGNDCYSNSFGNGCANNSFGKYFKYNAIGNDVSYIEIPTEKIYHTQILNGTKGTSSKKLTIEFTPETTYGQFAGFTSDGVLKIWVDADESISIVNITYNELKELRNNSKLKPSQHYRITDFVTTVANDEEARSAGHPFDIIVLASEKNKLQEECYAIQHEGDEYFANCNLAAWKIWYCLDNDTTKYAWADTANGKGVIYRMIDEWQNDCPYDFKNVQFKRYAVEDTSSNGELSDLDGTYIGYNGDMTGLAIADQNNFVWVYTFSFGDRTTTPNDASIIGYNKYELGERYGEKGYYGDNTIKPTSSIVTTDNEIFSVFSLNNIVWWSNNTTYRSLINGNRIESECFNMTLSGNGTIIEHDCRNFIMGDKCYGNVFNTACSNNTFGNDCYNNSFGNGCSSNTFGNGCQSNTFGNDCYGNSFGNGCSSNTFGNNCDDNSFGNSCGSNSFGDNCSSNTFGNGCIINTFGNNCRGNSFGNYFQYNALGNHVQYVEIPTEKIYHTQILNGTKGTFSNKLTLEFTPETTYSQFAGFTSDKVLATWVEADAPHDVVDGGSY